MTLESILEWTTRENAYIFQTFLVIFLTLIFDFLQRKILSRLRSRLEKTRYIWDDAAVEALSNPLSLIIWVAGIAFAANIVRKSTGAAIFEAVNPLRDTVILGSISWFLVRVIDRAHHNAINKHPDLDKTTVDAVAKLLKISVVITGGLVILQTLGFSVSGVLAFGGIGGIAIGFAAKDLLANFFGGLIVYLDRPFAVGDWIRSPDKEIEGVVENIGWRVTRIRTFDKRPLYVPNSVFTSIAVENPSRMTHRRIYETIGIRYQDAEKMPEITRHVKEMLFGHPEIDSHVTLIVNFNSFAPSSLDFFVYTFTKTTDWVRFHEIKQDVLLKIMKIIEGNGAEIAFPTSTIHLARDLHPLDIDSNLNKG
ncbi:MAG: mechanosensitive ion channel protein MscS [Nitrospinae bacterium CG11_big_fil_rev_8_21_14_0_20_56_8]|nr:MAG: mechanosensitive ion channel protein MscS [Nitrospinae bacterium CG11_big_fil_rev_8_21_14_0_20_56_8]